MLVIALAGTLNPSLVNWLSALWLFAGWANIVSGGPRWLLFPDLDFGHAKCTATARAHFALDCQPSAPHSSISERLNNSFGYPKCRTTIPANY